MSWCNYYYNPNTLELLEDDYKSQANLDECIPCALKWELTSPHDLELVSFTTNKEDELFKNYFNYFSSKITYYAQRNKTTDKILLDVMDKYDIDSLIINVN